MKYSVGRPWRKKYLFFNKIPDKNVVSKEEDKGEERLNAEPSHIQPDTIKN